MNQTLSNILESMIVPKARRKDILWLLRNLHFQNSTHPNFARAIELIKSEAKKLRQNELMKGLKKK